jgi:hypothetical protein
MDDTHFAERAYAAVRGASKETTKRHQITGRHIGKVVDAYDGDTCRVAIAIPTWDRRDDAAVVEYLNVRMLGYDAPEMKKQQLPYGREVKAVFHALVLDKVVVLDIPVPKKPDPYGRVLAHMYALERGAHYTLPYTPEPPSGGAACWYAITCCFPCSPCQPPRPGVINVTGTDSTSGARGTVTLGVRKREVAVPITVDVPSGYVTDDAGLSSLIHVNRWMIDNARVKEYDGKAARGEWTADELENGV